MSGAIKMFDCYRALGPTELILMVQRATFQGLSVLLLKFQSDKEIQMQMLYCSGSKKNLYFVSIL
jgi:hypothetical protein